MCEGRAVRGACCATCVGRGLTRPIRAHSTITFFADRLRLQQRQNSNRSTRVSMLQMSTKHTAVSSMLHLHPAKTPPHDFVVGLRRPRVGMASPHGPCLRWGTSSGLVRGKPSAMPCAYIRDVDDAGFLLTRCIHSPGTTRVLLTNKIVVALQTLKTKPNPEF